MSVYAHIAQVKDPHHREALKELARRLSTIEPLNPSAVTPALSTTLSTNGQRLTNVGSSQQSKDLVTLDDVRGHVQARLADLFRAIQGYGTPLG